MSIPAYITPKAFRSLKKQLQTQAEVHCLDQTSYILALLVARHLLIEGHDVKAKVVNCTKQENR
jgi:hypothetical protein